MNASLSLLRQNLQERLISTEQQITREGQALEQLGTQANENIRKERQNTRQRFRCALNRKKRLQTKREEVDTLSPRWSEEEKGVWNAAGYLLLSDIDQDLQRAVWERLPHSPFKLFQEIFSDPSQYVVPSIEQTGRTFVFEERNLRTLSLEPCLIHPDRISDATVQALHLAEVPPRMPALEKLKRKAKAIPRLREIFTNAAPLRNNNHRIHIVRDGNPAINGKILYTRKNLSHPEQKELRVYPDLYSAYRKTHHQEKNSDEELGLLLCLKIELEQHQQALLDYRASMPDEEKKNLRSKTGLLAIRFQRTLKKVRNDHKVEALVMLQKTEHLLEMKNVTAALTCIVGILNRLRERRPDEMREKSRFNADDRFILQEKIVEGEQHTHFMQRALKTLIPKMEALVPNMTLFNGSNLSRAQRTAQAQGLLNKLSHDLQQWQWKNMIAQPFTTFQQIIHSAFYHDLPDAMDRGDGDAFLASLHQMQEALNNVYPPKSSTK